MNKKDFIYGFHTSVSGKHLHSVSRHSRKDKLTSCKVFVKDTKTGIEKTYSIPEGHYSKKEMQKLRATAIDTLMEELFQQRKKK